MEENNNHSYRMYCFVERHLSALDKGIQLAHSIVEYGNIKDKSCQSLHPKGWGFLETIHMNILYGLIEIRL